MITVDHRCSHEMCRETGRIYRMIGQCINCDTKPILILYSATHDASNVDCPACGNYWSVAPVRMATADEIPVA